MYLPMDGNILSNLLPKIDGLIQSGMLSELIQTIKGETTGNLQPSSKSKIIKPIK